MKKKISKVDRKIFLAPKKKERGKKLLWFAQRPKNSIAIGKNLHIRMWHPFLFIFPPFLLTQLRLFRIFSLHSIFCPPTYTHARMLSPIYAHAHMRRALFISFRSSSIYYRRKEGDEEENSEHSARVCDKNFPFPILFFFSLFHTVFLFSSCNIFMHIVTSFVK